MNIVIGIVALILIVAGATVVGEQRGDGAAITFIFFGVIVVAQFFMWRGFIRPMAKRFATSPKLKGRSPSLLAWLWYVKSTAHYLIKNNDTLSLLVKLGIFAFIGWIWMHLLTGLLRIESLPRALGVSAFLSLATLYFLFKKALAHAQPDDFERQVMGHAPVIRSISINGATQTGAAPDASAGVTAAKRQSETELVDWEENNRALVFSLILFPVHILLSVIYYTVFFGRDSAWHHHRRLPLQVTNNDQEVLFWMLLPIGLGILIFSCRAWFTEGARK